MIPPLAVFYFATPHNHGVSTVQARLAKTVTKLDKEEAESIKLKQKRMQSRASSGGNTRATSGGGGNPFCCFSCFGGGSKVEDIGENSDTDTEEDDDSLPDIKSDSGLSAALAVNSSASDADLPMFLRRNEAVIKYHQVILSFCPATFPVFI